MENQICLQCKKITNTTDNRIVRDSCGHSKCRTCLVNEIDGCLICLSGEKLAGSDRPLPAPTQARQADEESRKDILNDAPVAVTAENENIDVNVKTRKRHPGVWPENIIVEEGKNGGQRMYYCNVCKKRFRARSHVAYHAYCGGLSKPHVCTQCHKEFASRSHYEYHMRVHEGNRSFMCDTCGAGFYAKSKLKRHILMHTGEKLFACEECGAAFNNAPSLRKHSYIHSGLKPHRCSHCGKLFRDSSNLRKHETKHKDVKYTCQECGKQYGMKWALVLHARSHCNDRRYSCEHCSRAFFSNKDRRRHVMVHSGNKPFKCALCSTRFRRKDNLDRHVRNTHPGTDASRVLQIVPADGLTDKTDITNKLSDIDKVQTEVDGGDDRSSLKCDSQHWFSQEQLSKNNACRVDQTNGVESNACIKDYIIEANNKRQSVIFGPIKHTSNNETGGPKKSGNGSEKLEDNQQTQVLNDEFSCYKYLKKKINNVELYKKILNTSREESEQKIHKPLPEYIHKKVNYELKSALFSKDVVAHKKSMGFNSHLPPLPSEAIFHMDDRDNATKEHKYTPESIELYKKILIKDYGVKKVESNRQVDSMKEYVCSVENERDQAKAELNSKKTENGGQDTSKQVSNGADMHWRRRMAHSSSQ